MKLSEKAAQKAVEHGAILVAGDASAQFRSGDVIEVSARVGLGVTAVEVMPVIDAPLSLVNVLSRRAGEWYFPLYSNLQCETAQQAALAQMLNDAGEGFDTDDLLAIEALDSAVSVVSVFQVKADDD